MNNWIKPRFYVDAMLGNIAKKLRFLGYDTAYCSDIDDNHLINEAKKDSRIIITKDEELANLVKKENILCILISSSEEIEQLLQIFKTLNLPEGFVNGSTARCSECNGRIENIEKKYLKKTIPEQLLERQNNFWKCTGCEKIYWEGSHVENLKKFVLSLNERL